MTSALRALFTAACRGARSRAPSIASCDAATPPWWCRQQWCAQQERGAAAALRRSLWTDTRGYEHFSGRGPVWRRPLVWRLTAGGALVCGGYYVSCLEEVPYTHRWHAILVSSLTEAALGKQVWEQTIREAQARRALLPPDHPASQLVRRVGRRVAAVASDGEGGGYSRHMKHQEWEFAVINDPQVNAFVAPGGKVVVYTGLLGLMTSEDELAAVIAHEAAHVVARHIAENLSRMQMIAATTVVANLLLGIPLSPDLLVLGFFLPHSRAAEAEADAIGIRLLARSCYDPAANVRMLQRLEMHEKKAGAGGGGRAAALLQTHPLTEDRVETVRKLLPEAYKIYKSSCSVLRQGWDELARAFG